MTDIIQLLPDHVANQIAAGEVVQRPASVVKELLENAIDAEASEIKLIIKDAGKTLVQVIDNGKGMSVTDARLCFERHATWAQNGFCCRLTLALLLIPSPAILPLILGAPLPPRSFSPRFFSPVKASPPSRSN